MADEKTGAAAAWTGSTGNAAKDLTPRTSFMAFATGVAGLICYIGSTDAVLTGLIFSITTNGAFMSMVAFDGIIRPRL